jgi:hypothetical protein
VVSQRRGGTLLKWFHKGGTLLKWSYKGGWNYLKAVSHRRVELFYLLRQSHIEMWNSCLSGLTKEGGTILKWFSKEGVELF